MVFKSVATNLVPNDRNGAADVFAHDLTTGITERISVGLGGVNSDGFSFPPTISNDGRFVTFGSAASNLVWADVNDASNVFVRDRQTGITALLDRGPDGVQGNRGTADVPPSISGDGSKIAFVSFATNLADVRLSPDYLNTFVAPNPLGGLTGQTQWINIGPFGVPDGSSGGPASNMDGTVIAFYSSASNLVAHDTNGVRDVFVAEAGSIERVSVSSSGAQANGSSQAQGGSTAISADGQVVAFYSAASNLVPQDTNGWTDVFVRDRTAGTTERISVASDGTEANGPSFDPSLSADGRLVAFHSLASNLVPNDTNGVSDVFVHDRLTGTTERVCGVQGNAFSISASISPGGNFVAFASAASNLVPNDTNHHIDIFVCDRASGTITRVSVSSGGMQGDGDSILPDISGSFSAPAGLEALPAAAQTQR